MTERAKGNGRRKDQGRGEEASLPATGMQDGSHHWLGQLMQTEQSALKQNVDRSEATVIETFDNSGVGEWILVVVCLTLLRLEGL